MKKEITVSSRDTCDTFVTVAGDIAKGAFGLIASNFIFTENA